jgi:Helix-turn-helix domain
LPWSLADDIADRIAIASRDELHDIHRDMWLDHANGKLSVDHTEVLSEAFRTRLEALQEHRTETRPKPRTAPSSAPRGSARRPNRPQRSRTREKLFGNGRPVPLDREAKNRILVLIRALTHPTEPGKHYGAITAKAAEVARVLLWVFHNVKTGLCIPGYDTIAEEAGCHRDTVAEAIKMLEAAGILTWCNRRARVTIKGVRKVIRISNSYRFTDPGSKSEFPSGTQNQDHLSLKKTAETTRTAAKRLSEETERTSRGVPDGVYPCEKVT